MAKSLFSLFIAILLALIIIPISFIYNIIVKKDKAKYIFNIAIGIDQLGGSVIYNQPDWTVSSWTYYKAEIQLSNIHKYFMRVIDLFFGKRHCFYAYNNEVSQITKEVLKHKNTL